METAGVYVSEACVCIHVCVCVFSPAVYPCVVSPLAVDKLKRAKQPINSSTLSSLSLSLSPYSTTVASWHPLMPAICHDRRSVHPLVPPSTSSSVHLLSSFFFGLSLTIVCVWSVVLWDWAAPKTVLHLKSIFIFIPWPFTLQPNPKDYLHMYEWNNRIHY